jgi:hypothetical protein
MNFTKKQLNSYQKFIDFAKNGKVLELEQLVFDGNQPYILETKYPKNIAKNILGFLSKEKNWNSLKVFFTTKFAEEKHLSEEKKINWFIDYLHSFDREIFQYLWEEKKFNNLQNKDIKKIIYKAINKHNKEVFTYLLETYKEQFSEEEQMDCLLNSINSIDSEKQCLLIFQTIEKIFPKIKYHQQKDRLFKVIKEKKLYEYANYLLWDKKIRLTTEMWFDGYEIKIHQMMEERRIFDSKAAKIINQMKKIESSIGNNNQNTKIQKI